MWLSSITVFGLLAVGAAYVADGRGDYGGYGNYGHFGQFGNNFERTLDNLETTINRLEERQQGQELRINDLIDTSSDNLGLQYDFYDVAQRDVNDEIAAQNARFARLDKDFALIRGLRAQLDKLEYTVAHIRVQVNKTDERGIATLAQVNDLDQNTYPTDEEITREAIEAGRINKGLECVFRQRRDNARLLSVLEFRTGQITTTQDFTTAKAYQVDLVLKSGVAKTSLPYPGFARNVAVYVNEFDLDRTGKRNYYNSDETENLFFHVTADYSKNVEVNANDQSDSGWSTNSISASVIAFKLQDSRLDINAPLEANQ